VGHSVGGRDVVEPDVARPDLAGEGEDEGSASSGRTRRTRETWRMP